MTILGIDNGISGSLVAISPLGQVIAWTPMPVKRVDSVNEVDVRELDDFLSKCYVNWTSSRVVIERPVGSKSASAARSMAGSFHALRALFELRGYDVTRVTARQWQKIMLGKGDTKELALKKAKELWPNEAWLRTSKCKKPHDGAIDAALIAEYARRYL